MHDHLQDATFAWNTLFYKGMQQVQFTLADLCVYFPEVDLPITITEESYRHFPEDRSLGVHDLLVSFLQQALHEEHDEYTEIIPGFSFRVPSHSGYVALVWWKANLLTYSYILATFNMQAQLVASLPLAIVQVQGDAILRQAAHINEVGQIYTVEGLAKGETFQAESNIPEQYLLLEDGSIQEL